MTNRDPQGPWYRGNVANFLCMACHVAMTLVPLHWQKLGFLDWQIGWLAASFSVAAIFARVGLGGWLERWGRRPFMIVGPLLLTSVCFLFESVGQHYWGWLALRVIQGCGLALSLTAMMTWVTDRSPVESIGRSQAVFGVSGLLGAAAGPILAEQLVEHYGFPVMFQAVGLAGLLAACLAATLPESRPGSRGRLGKSSFTAVVSLRELRPMLVVTLPFGWFAGTVMTFLAPLVKQAGLGGVGVFFGGFACASVVVRLVAGHSIDRVSAGRLIPLSLLTLTLSSGLLASLTKAPSEAFLVVAALLNGIGHGFLFPALSLFTVRHLRLDQHGTGMAVFTGTFETGILLGAVGAGYVSEYTNTSTAFGLAAGLLVACLPFFKMELTRASKRSQDG